MALTVITNRRDTDEQRNRAVDFLQSDGRLSFQNDVPLSCYTYSADCMMQTKYFLGSCLNAFTKQRAIITASPVTVSS